MSIRRIELVVISLAVVAGASFGTGWVHTHGSPGRADAAEHSAPAPKRPHHRVPDTAPSSPAPSSPAPSSPAPSSPALSSPAPAAPTVPATPATPPTPAPGPRLFGPGDASDRVRDLQARLKQLDWFEAHVTGYYGDVTEAAVKGFQGKRGIAVTGVVDQRTLDLLHGMTRQPTQAELADAEPTTNAPGEADPRCLTGRVLCVDKTSRTLRWMIDGRVQRTFDIRYGRTGLETREGEFSVYLKDADHMSQLYHVLMPYSLFFSGGEAVHYSSDFATNGYGVGSHGCVNVRDRDGMAWLFSQVRVGDKVVVYRS